MLPYSIHSLLAIAASVAASPLAIQRSSESIIGEWTITADNTLNATTPPEQPQIGSNSLALDIVNSYDNGPQMYAYIIGHDIGGRNVMLDASGQFYYPNTFSEIPLPIPDDANAAIPLNRGRGNPKHIVIPDSIESGRVYIADARLQFGMVYNHSTQVLGLVTPSVMSPTDPSVNITWGFMELTNQDVTGLFANLSFVDWVGLVMGMRLTLGNGQVKTVPGLEPEALDTICHDLDEQSSNDKQPWSMLCVSRACDSPGCQKKALRIISPNLYTDSNPTFMPNYYAAYVNEVYAKYSNEDLIVDTQNDQWGRVPCRVQGGTQLFCEGDNIPFPKPSVLDIWSCDKGSFATTNNDRHNNIRARLCAAFTRTQLLLPEGNITPRLDPYTYYITDPTNHYSRIVHKYLIGGIGYAFAHDDVHPNGFPDPSGLITGHQPQLLEIFIGGGL